MTTSYPRLLCYRTLLGPLLLWQGYRTRRHALRLPEAEGPRGGVEGQTDASPLRLLFVGDSSAAGVGVSHQNAALALPTAQTAAQRFYRRVHWQLFARSGLNTPEARAFLREAPIERADIVVTALGTNDVTSQHAPKSFRKHYRALLDELFERTGATSAIITG
ncbi:MAG: GDSL-type esterase/lipase family protein, partial [Pseudomonadota bacterium]